jgi:hypothetical protein
VLCGLVWLQERIPKEEIGLCAGKYDNHSIRFNSQHNRELDLYDHLMHSNLHFVKEQCILYELLLHSKLHSITHVATKVHVILRSFVVLTWMCDTSKLV